MTDAPWSTIPGYVQHIREHPVDRDGVPVRWRCSSCKAEVPLYGDPCAACASDRVERLDEA